MAEARALRLRARVAWYERRLEEGCRCCSNGGAGSEPNDASPRDSRLLGLRCCECVIAAPGQGTADAVVPSDVARSAYGSSAAAGDLMSPPAPAELKTPSERRERPKRAAAELFTLEVA